MAKTLHAGHVFDKRDAKVHLDRISPDPPRGITQEGARARLKAIGEELFDLQDAMWGAKTHALLVVLQGRDGAGKDGAIKNVAGCFNPRGVIATSFGIPTPEEKQHDFLWRVHRHAPRLGETALFNRSHYEDVLVVRVHDLAPKSLWKQRYGHITDFEELLAEHDTLVIKFFLHISADEQEQRLLDREADPEKAWKLNVGDWKERDFWDDYTEAYEDAISRTARKHAPWVVVPANAKWYRDLVVAEAMLQAMKPHRKAWERTLGDMGRHGREALAAFRAERDGRKK
jgi:PPK2 family polyphosphate:nucleotide phosphotransferase